MILANGVHGLGVANVMITIRRVEFPHDRHGSVRAREVEVLFPSAA